MTKKQRYDGVIAWFEKNMPVAESELQYKSPYQLLVAVILSAQCTDKRVNMTTPAFFEAFPEPETLAVSTPEAVFDYIKSISYPNAKSRHLVEMAQMLVKDFGGEVPGDIENLMKLPGVGRKTANVVINVAFGIPSMPVDTHVFRLSNRIGLTDHSKTPLETERELVKYIPGKILGKAHHWLILHGRYVCTARKPHCDRCGITKYCAYYNSGL